MVTLSIFNKEPAKSLATISPVPAYVNSSPRLAASVPILTPSPPSITMPAVEKAFQVISFNKNWSYSPLSLVPIIVFILLKLSFTACPPDTVLLDVPLIPFV